MICCFRFECIMQHYTLQTKHMGISAYSARYSPHSNVFTETVYRISAGSIFPMRRYIPCKINIFRNIRNHAFSHSAMWITSSTTSLAASQTSSNFPANKLKLFQSDDGSSYSTFRFRKRCHKNSQISRKKQLKDVLFPTKKNPRVKSEKGYQIVPKDAKSSIRDAKTVTLFILYIKQFHATTIRCRKHGLLNQWFSAEIPTASVGHVLLRLWRHSIVRFGSHCLFDSLCSLSPSSHVTCLTRHVRLTPLPRFPSVLI